MIEVRKHTYVFNFIKIQVFENFCEVHFLNGTSEQFWYLNNTEDKKFKEENLIANIHNFYKNK